MNLEDGESESRQNQNNPRETLPCGWRWLNDESQTNDGHLAASTLTMLLFAYERRCVKDLYCQVYNYPVKTGITSRHCARMLVVTIPVPCRLGTVSSSVNSWCPPRTLGNVRVASASLLTLEMFEPLFNSLPVRRGKLSITFRDRPLPLLSLRMSSSDIM